MKTKHVIRVKATKEEIYTGSSIEDCESLMKTSFLKHIESGNPMKDFSLEAVTIYELEEHELVPEDQDYDDFHESH